MWFSLSLTEQIKISEKHTKLYLGVYVFKSLLWTTSYYYIYFVFTFWQFYLENLHKKCQAKPKLLHLNHFQITFIEHLLCEVSLETQGKMWSLTDHKVQATYWWKRDNCIKNDQIPLFLLIRAALIIPAVSARWPVPTLLISVLREIKQTHVCRQTLWTLCVQLLASSWGHVLLTRSVLPILDYFPLFMGPHLLEYVPVWEHKLPYQATLRIKGMSHILIITNWHTDIRYYYSYTM